MRGCCAVESSSSLYSSMSIVNSCKLALNEGQSSLAVLCAIALMSAGVGSIAAVGIRSVAVGLDLGCRWALEAGGPGSESMSRTGADIVGKTCDVARVTHEDRSLDISDGSSDDGDGSVGVTLVGIPSTAKCVVENLTTLGVSDKDELGAGALAVKCIDGGCDSFDASDDGVGIAD